MPNNGATALRFFEVKQVPCQRNVEEYDALMKMLALKRSGSYKQFFVAQGNDCGCPAFRGLLFCAREVPLEQEFASMRLYCSVDGILPWLDTSLSIGSGPTFSLEGTLETVLKNGTAGPTLKVMIPNLSIKYRSEDPDHHFEAPQDFVSTSITIQQAAKFVRKLRNDKVGLCESVAKIELWVDDYNGPAKVSFYGEVCPPEKL